MEDNDQAMQRAVKFLAVRAHSAAELKEKLLRRDLPSAAVHFALAECKRLGYLDDRQFAKEYLEEMRGRGWGDRKCRMGLQKKGVDRAVIDEIFADGDDPEAALQRAAAVFERKWQTLQREPDPRKRQEKVFRFMVSRGFPAETVMTLIRRASRPE